MQVATRTHKDIRVRMRFRLRFAALALLFAHITCAAAEPVYSDSEHRFQLETVAQGFAHPWSLAFLPDGRLLVTERPGRLNLVDANTGARTPVEGLPEIVAVGQGGLLDVALHPRYEQNGWIYLSYVAAGPGGYGTHVGRGRLRGERLTDFEVLFRATPFTDRPQHFGSRLAFDRQGFLFISLGDRNERDRAQDVSDHNGSLIRLHHDGRIPQDNPFIGRRGAQPAIYSIGHRNIQGLTVHPQTGQVWLHEHGPRGGDEINLPEPGKNYGWPIITYGREYSGPPIGTTHREGLEQPVHQWTPSIAPSGMTFYQGNAFPNWQGDLFVGALAGRHLARLRFDGTTLVEEQRLLEKAGLRIRDVREGPDGLLYLLVDAASAPLLRLRPPE